VTGAGQGIGREVAIAFARLGASIVIAEISALGQETERIVKEGGGKALFVKTDVSSESDVADLARSTQEMFGRADILINNAIVCPVAAVQDLDVGLWDRVMAVNLRGTFLTCKAFLPGMLAHKRGTIVNMVSTDAMPFLSAYIASKQGITGFSQSLAAEVGPEGVRVIALAPAMVNTPGLRGAAQDLAPRLGLSRDEFLSMAIPADHAATATAYLVVALADEYHGEQIDGYTVPERAGLTTAPGSDVETVSPTAEPAPALAADRAEALRQAVTLSKRLQEVIAKTDAEFKQLPIFVRPLAQRGFKSKAGQRIQDWARTAAKLSAQMKKVEAFDGQAEAEFRAGYPHLKDLLGKLIVHYQEVPAETARFTKDEDALQQVRQLTAERVALIHSLDAALETIQT